MRLKRITKINGYTRKKVFKVVGFLVF